jgi:hypothetical protein
MYVFQPIFWIAGLEWERGRVSDLRGEVVKERRQVNMAPEIWKGREGGLVAQKKVLYMCRESDLRRDLNNEEIADPVAGGGDGGAALAEAEGKNFRRIDPDSSLEADGECAFEDEQHGCCSFTGFVGGGGVVLDLED